MAPDFLVSEQFKTASYFPSAPEGERGAIVLCRTLSLPLDTVRFAAFGVELPDDCRESCPFDAERFVMPTGLASHFLMSSHRVASTHLHRSANLLLEHVNTINADAQY